jgi:hypothetical protein
MADFKTSSNSSEEAIEFLELSLVFDESPRRLHYKIRGEIRTELASML